jgi:hypothetical protein
MNTGLRIYFLWTSNSALNDTLVSQILPLIDSRAKIFDVDSEAYQKIISDPEHPDSYSLRFSAKNNSGYPKLVLAGEHYSGDSYKNDFENLIVQAQDISGFIKVINNNIDKLLQKRPPS